MTVTKQTRFVRRAGNGIAVDFPFDFKIPLGTLIVQRVRVSDGVEFPVSSLDYTLTLNADNTGKITYVDPDGDPWTSDWYIDMWRDTPITQEITLSNQTAYNANVTQTAWDKLTMICQELDEGLARTIQIEIGDYASDPSLPGQLTEAVLGLVDALGDVDEFLSIVDAIQNFEPTYEMFTGNGVQTAFTLLAAPATVTNLFVYIDGVLQAPGVDYNTAGTTLTFTVAPDSEAKIHTWMLRYVGGAPGADSVRYTLPWYTPVIERTVAQRLGEYPSVKDFGAVGDGVTDDTAAIQAAVSSGARRVHVPEGRYLLTDQVFIEHCTLYGEGYSFETMFVDDMYDLYGTVFICGFETSTAESLFYLGAFGRLEDLMAYYPNQEATRPVNWTPITTPWFCTTGDWLLRPHNVRHRQSGMNNVLFLEFSHGVRMRKGGERGIFKAVFGNPFIKGLEIDGNYSVTRIEDWHFWPFGGNAGMWQPNERVWALNNLKHCRFGRCDGLMVKNLMSFGPGTAIEFYPCEDPDFPNYATTNFHIVDAYLDNSNTSLKVTGTYVTNQHVGGHIIGTSMQHWTNSDGAIVTEQENIVIESNLKQITLSSCRLQSGANQRNGGYVRMNCEHGKLVFNGSNCSKWDKAGVGAVGFVQTGSESKIILGDMQFFDPGNVEADLVGQEIFTGRVRLDGLIIPFVPTVTLATPGDFSISNINTRIGWVKYDGECIHVNIRLICQVNNTTGSGALHIGNLPHTFEAVSEAVVALGGTGINLDAATVSVSAQSNVGQQYLGFVQERDAAGPLTILGTNIINGGQLRLLSTFTLRV